MSKDKIGLTLNGDVPLDLFAEAIQRFSELVDLLSREIGGNGDIQWQIIDLDAGSATTTVLGISPDIELVERVVGAYEVIGYSLQSKKPVPYSPSVVKAAQSITAILNGKISSLEFFTPGFSAYLSQSTVSEDKPARVSVYGSVSGLVETLSRRQTLRFILYDHLFDKAVKCFFDEGQHEMMRDVWDKRVTVTGTVLRDQATGRPLEVRAIEDVQILSDRAPGRFKAARGLIPREQGAYYAEQIIRQIRDEE